MVCVRERECVAYRAVSVILSLQCGVETCARIRSSTRRLFALRAVCPVRCAYPHACVAHSWPTYAAVAQPSPCDGHVMQVRTPRWDGTTLSSILPPS
eukprot:1607201-Rhodomonas_salina.1